MTNKEAIDIIDREDERNHYEQRFTHNEEALTIVLSLAERMAMYEWWWGMDGFDSCSILGDLGDYKLPLTGEQYERVMKAWKENT